MITQFARSAVRAGTTWYRQRQHGPVRRAGVRALSRTSRMQMRARDCARWRFSLPDRIARADADVQISRTPDAGYAGCALRYGGLCVGLLDNTDMDHRIDCADIRYSYRRLDRQICRRIGYVLFCWICYCCWHKNSLLYAAGLYVVQVYGACSMFVACLLLVLVMRFVACGMRMRAVVHAAHARSVSGLRCGCRRICARAYG